MRRRVDELLGDGADGCAYHRLRGDPGRVGGRVGLETFLEEAEKLRVIQRVLDESRWRERMTEHDLRALSPLVYAHVNPYGVFELDMNERLDLERKMAS
jgi:hypothetical protein